MTRLPFGWELSSIASIADISSGSGFPKDRQGKQSGEFPFAKVSDITKAVKYFDGYLSAAVNYVDEEDLRTLGAKPVAAGSTVFAKIGEALRLNRRALSTIPLILDNNCMALTPRAEIAPEFLYRFMQTIDLSPLAIATSVPSVRTSDIARILIPLPPLAEQRRIVAKLDSLFERSKNAREELARIPQLIERYKQAILAAVMSGDEAGQKWPLLPLEDLITEGPTNGYSPGAGDNPDGTLSLRLSATTKRVLDLSERGVKRLNEVISQTSKFWLRPGDILIQRANSLEHVGATAIYEGPSQTYIYPDLMMRIRVASPVMGSWIWRYCSSPAARKYFVDNATGTAGNMPKITGATIRKMLVPLPPMERLPLYLKQLDLALGRADAILREAVRASELVARLEQATLAKAFRGELVAAGE